MNRIALTNLEAYNNGELRFVWLNLPYTEEEFTEAVEAIGNPEEYFVTDYETEIEGLKIDEFPNYQELNEFFERVERLQNHEIILEIDILCALTEVLSDHKEALDVYESGDYVFYSHRSLREVAEEMVDEGFFGDVPKALKSHIDYDSIANDLDIEGYTVTAYGVVKVH